MGRLGSGVWVPFSNFRFKDVDTLRWVTIGDLSRCVGRQSLGVMYPGISWNRNAHLACHYWCIYRVSVSRFYWILKQASHWLDFCSRIAPQYDVPSRTISVARSLSRRQGDAQLALCRALSCHLSRISYELFTKCVTSNVTRVHLTISS